MRAAPAAVFGFLRVRGLLRPAALHLLAFFLAVAIAPHRHLNSFEDLISDGPSDSGVFVEGNPFEDPTGVPQWGSARVLDDDPCLACFHHDFDSTTEVIAFLSLVPTVTPMPATQATLARAIPDTPRRPVRSRAPPAHS